MTLETVNANLIICLIFVTLNLEKVNPFITIGKYPELSDKDVNLRECGLRYVPRNISLHYNAECFANKYPNQTYWLLPGEVISERDSVSSRIYRGSDADDAEAPWAVLLRTERIIPIPNNPLVHYRSITFCSGVVITWQWLMTAAHCINDSISTDIRVGSNIRGDGDERTINAHNFFIHHNYTPVFPDNITYDIALIKVDDQLPRKVRGSKFLINTLCLPQKTDRLNREYISNMTLFGFGLIAGRDVAPDRLQKGTFTLLPCNMCITCQHLCADHQDLDARACMGDSGSGLVDYSDKHHNRAVLAGITSSILYRSDDHYCNYDILKTVWAAIPLHMDWILDVIRNRSN